MAPIAAVNADLTIAVSLNGAGSDALQDHSAGPETRATTEWLNRLLRSTSALLDTAPAKSVLGRFASAEEAGDETAEQETETSIPKLGSFAVMNRTIDIAQAALARHQLATYPPDLLIEVPRSACRSLDFHRAAEVIDLGHELAAQALDTLKSENP
jgi:NTE family protein